MLHTLLKVSEHVLMWISIVTFFVLSGLLAFGGTVKEDIITPYWDINCPRGNLYGSGTYIQVGPEKLILTAGHVAEDFLGESTVVTVSSDGKRHEVKTKSWSPVQLMQQRAGTKKTVVGHVIWQSPIEEKGGNDLALIRPEEDLGSVAKMDLSAVMEEGEDAWYCGAGGLHASLEKTIISRTQVPNRYGPQGKEYFVVNGVCWFGHSGSGVFVRRGSEHVLVGVLVRAATNPMEDPKSPALCQSPGTVRDFLANYIRETGWESLPMPKLSEPVRSVPNGGCSCCK
jgi:hypothetical protein